LAIRSSICIPLLLAAGLSLQAQPRQGLVKPIWVQVLPQQSGRVYAMGVAVVAPSEAQALKQAAVNARVEVLTRLRANVQSQTDVQSTATVQRELGGRTTGSAQQRVGQSTSIQTQATELPGLVVEETWLDGPGATAYALAYLDVPLAERELGSRFEAVRKDLARETPAAGGLERLRKLKRLKGTQTELDKLDGMAGLLAAGGGDPALRSAIRDTTLALHREVDQLRAGLTLCVTGDKEGEAGDVATLLRNIVLKEGLGWSETDGEFRLQMRVQGSKAGLDIARKRWWEYQHTSPDYIVARGVLELTLLDREGTSYQSAAIEAKGVGTTEFQADQRLLKDYKAQLEKTFAKWLDELTR
jgi:hypothetical protein